VLVVDVTAVVVFEVVDDVLEILLVLAARRS
jgi:hypothetical protein